jgi:hypothetical protein
MSQIKNVGFPLVKSNSAFPPKYNHEFLICPVIYCNLGHINKNSWLAPPPAHKKSPAQDFLFLFYFKKTQLLLIKGL